MRVSNDQVFNQHPIFSSSQPELFWGTDAPDTSSKFTNKAPGTVYYRPVAAGHTQKWVKVKNDGTANDYFCELGVIAQSLAYSDFTDGGGASGTKTLANDIPVGAIVDPISILDVTGFTGDTTAVIIVGESGDTDRYMTATPSIFTTAAAINAGVPSGIRHHTAAKTPLVTATGGTDWGAVSPAGRVTIRIPYHF